MTPEIFLFFVSLMGRSPISTRNFSCLFYRMGTGRTRLSVNLRYEFCIIKFLQLVHVSKIRAKRHVFSLELVRHGDGETFNTGEIRNIISVIFSRITHYTLPRTRYKNMSVLEKGTLRFYEKPDKCVKYSID